MTTTQLARRLERIEARRNPGVLYVCWCAHRNGRENTPEHDPGCPALTAGDNDTVLVIRYEDDPRNAYP